MSYDPNSLEAKIGKLGETIVKEHLVSRGLSVSRPDTNEKSLMDFLCVDRTTLQSFYVEVKVKKLLPYAYGQYPCYTFAKKQIESYKSFLQKSDAVGYLFIVDPESKEILAGSLTAKEGVIDHVPAIEVKVYIDCKEFPFDQNSAIGDMRFYHHDQFKKVRDLTPKEIKAFSKKQTKGEAISALEKYLDDIEEKLKNKEQVSDFEWQSLSAHRPERAKALNNVSDIISDAIFGKEQPPNEQPSPATLLRQLADIVSVEKEKIAQFILDLRLEEFEQKQEQLRQSLLQGG